MIHFRLGAAAVLAMAATSQPAFAGHRSWDTASTIGVYSLGALALGTPAVQGDWKGVEQAGASIAVGAGIAYGLKNLVHEDRPDHSGNDSFPSAHTAAAFASAMTLDKRYGWKLGVPALVVASFVGAARVESRRHHWYDALAGAGIGSASGLLLTHKRTDNVRLIPWGDSRSGGVSLSMRF